MMKKISIQYATIKMSQGTKERKEGSPTMKTLDIVTMSKGFYLTIRYCGMAKGREYFKTKTALNARVKELKKEGYAVA